MNVWPAIMEARDAFADLGERHGLLLRVGAVYSPDYFPATGGAAVQIEVVTEELLLLMLHAVPIPAAPAWLAALHDVLDVPDGLLPPSRTWVATTDLVVEHDRRLGELPATVV